MINIKMKHLRKYNESKTRILTEDIINECFAHAFDLIVYIKYIQT